MNAEFYRAEYRSRLVRIRNRYPDIAPLGAAADVICGPFGSAITFDDYVAQGVPLLRISNISADGSLDLEDVIFISQEKSKALAGTRVHKGDLVISQRGTLGMPAVVSDAFPAFNISANLIALRCLRNFSPEYLQLVLASDIGAKQIARLQSGQVHAKVTTGDIASLLVPPVANQRELVDAMEAARGARRAKLGEADALLAGLDAYSLETLGLETPCQDGRHAFAMTTGALRAQSRLGPDYFHPERVLAIRAMLDVSSCMPCAKLSDVVTFVRDQISAPGPNYLGLAGVQSQTGELSGVAEDVEGTCFKFRAGDVLFARLRPYLNKVWCADVDGCCSPEFHVLRVDDSGTLTPEFLAAALRSSLILAQTRHMMTGNTHPRLANEDVAELVIPIPEPAVQESIAAEVRRRRARARALRAEAEAGWTQAKQWFEEQLLGRRHDRAALYREVAQGHESRAGGESGTGRKPAR